MTDSERSMADRRLTNLVRTVRRRWKLRLALRGLAWATGISVLVFLLAGVAVERARFSPEALLWLRLASWGTLGLTFFLFVVRPLLRPVTDSQVALYLEEHEPSLQHAFVSALEASRNPGFSRGLSGRVLEHALDRAAAVENGRRVEQGALYRFGGALTGIVVASLLLAVLGPTSLRHGVGALLAPTRDAATVNPYAMDVEPGNTAIARGSDLVVRAAPRGFEAGEVSIFTSSGEGTGFQRLSMLPNESGLFEVMLLGVEQDTRYFVEASGVRSPTFTVEVAELPYVENLDLTYHFPDYTGLSPRVVEGGGDVAALPGTVVELSISSTIATPGGRLLLDGEAASELEVGADGTLSTRFTVEDTGLYAIELARDNGEMVSASPEYTIDVLQDMEPSVHFSEPGRDMPASPIEEVYLEMEALDDYGIGDLRLVYSVNGGAEDTVSVFRTDGPPLPEVSAGHTLYLEEWQLEPGDLVSYYALVRDNRRLGSEQVVASDMYFLNVRPFEREYREAEQQGGGGQAGGAQGAETALSEMQRQVISATFNLIRQRDSYAEGEFAENVVSVALAQERLREQVTTLLERMGNRGLTEEDPGFRDVSAILPDAADAMTRAHELLTDEALQDALPVEQKALRFLQQAEETYERYVTTSQNQQGGGGGGGNPAADDLADLFELELDKLQNQYETVRRGQQQQADAQVDEIMEELEELARRQEQEAERQRRRAQAGMQGTAGAGASQRNLADETEEAARQLQRLARERADQELERTARAMQEAAEAMRRSASEGGNTASTGASEALRRLEDARRSLQENRAGRAGRSAQEALRQVDELQRQQREVQRAVRDLPSGGEERREVVDRLRERKNQMTDAVRQLEQELDRSASSAQQENPQAARKLQAGADRIRESSLKEKLQYSRGTIVQWDPESALTLELGIEGDLEDVREELEGALEAAGAQERNPLTEALDETRDLVRGMEAMERRLNEGSSRAGEQADEAGDAASEADGQPGRTPEGTGEPGTGDTAGATEGTTDERATEARAGGGGGRTRGDPRRPSAEEIRQYRNEFERRAGQVRDVRERLEEAGRSTEDLQSVLDAMERLAQEGAYDDPTQVAQLQAEALEALKRLEFGLRREVEGETPQRATLGGSDDVPDGYRALVEEYYRTLAREGGR
ncbi:MAG: DUF4175 family protein [Gemmatimonadota bacterium]|nr:DUF4175 family protein [Gemmatimonadota bacterium]